jgi:3-aminobutyryl-CoA ammonia-lyase
MSEAQTDPRIEAIGEVMVRLRMGGHDGHYAGGLVDGARMLQLFGDVATELLIRLDGDEGLFRAYESVEFLAPVYVGDYIEAIGRIVTIGKTSRKIEFLAQKVVSALPPERGGKAVSSADFLKKPVIVCRATGTCVTPVELQRGITV